MAFFCVVVASLRFAWMHVKKENWPKVGLISTLSSKVSKLKQTLQTSVCFRKVVFLVPKLLRWLETKKTRRRDETCAKFSLILLVVVTDNKFDYLATLQDETSIIVIFAPSHLLFSLFDFFDQQQQPVAGYRCYC